MAAYADLTLLNDPVNLDAYRQVGPAQYMPHAYREKIHYPPAPGSNPEYDLAFVGTGFPSRARFFSPDGPGRAERPPRRAVDGPPRGLPHPDWTATESDDCIDNDETAAIYRRARTGINFYRRESEAAHEGEGVACGPREIEMAASGLWFARDPRPESDDLFPMLPRVSSPERHRTSSGGRPPTRASAPRRRPGPRRGRGPHLHRARPQLLRLLDRQPVTNVRETRPCPAFAGTAGTRRSTCPPPAPASPRPSRSPPAWTINQVADKDEVTAFGDPNKTYVAGLPDSSGTSAVSWMRAPQTYVAAADGLPRKMYLYWDVTNDPNSLLVWQYAP